MPRLTFAGHPVHAQLVELPLGLVPASLAFDLAHVTTGKKQYADAAFLSLLGTPEWRLHGDRALEDVLTGIPMVMAVRDERDPAEEHAPSR